MADLGHEVVAVDVDAAKIAALSAGDAPFFEPGLGELLASSLASGRLTFTTDLSAVAGSAVHFVAVGTPQVEDGYAADLRFVDAAIESLLPHLAAGDLVVGKSTVPVGTAARLAELIEPTGARLAWNPEFLREGFALQDTLHPDRLVYGVRPGDEAAVAALDEVYAAALAEDTPRIVTDFATAELVKVSANAFLATKISFINAMAEIAEATGADVTQLADAIGHDPRIGRRFLGAGLGFGGGCLPKDIRGFIARADELGVGQSLAFLEDVDAINLRRRDRAVQLAVELVGGDPVGKRIAVLGLAFKPDSDDVRDSPALVVAARLAALGADVVATDPQAIHTSLRLHPELVTVPTVLEAATGADAVLLLTEWREYRELDPGALGSVVRQRAVLDGRNVLDPGLWRAAGWRYAGLGRP
jgi:UDPglucose 6-dehydrogenase